MTVARQLAIMSVVMMLLFLVVGMTSFASVFSLIKVNEAVTHTGTILDELHALQYHLAECDSAVRGYIITGQEEFLQPYKVSAEETHSVLHELQQPMSDNADQTKKLNQLVPLVESHLSGFDKLIATYKSQGQQATADIIHKQGQKRLDEVRNRVEELIDTEKELFHERADEVTRSSEGSLLTVIFGVLLEMALVFFYNLSTAQTLNRCIRLLVKAMDNFDRGRFDTVPAINSNDEFGLLSRSLQQLGRTMQRMQDELQGERLRNRESAMTISQIENKLNEASTAFSGLQSTARRLGGRINIETIAESLEQPAPIAEQVISSANALTENYERQVIVLQSTEKVITAAANSTEVFERESEKCTAKVKSLAGSVADLQAHTSTLARLEDQMLWISNTQLPPEVQREAQHIRGLIEECRQHNTSIEKELTRTVQYSTSIEQYNDESHREAKAALKNLQDISAQLAELRGLQNAASIINKAVLDTAYGTMQTAGNYYRVLMDLKEQAAVSGKDVKELQALGQSIQLLIDVLRPIVMNATMEIDRNGGHAITDKSRVTEEAK